MSKKWDEADDLLRRKLAIAWGGVAVGVIAKHARIGTKAKLSKEQKDILDAVVDRGNEWGTVFAKRGATGEEDVGAIAAMPLTLLLSLPQFQTTSAVWTVGNLAIETALAVAESEIVKKQYSLTSSDLIKRTEQMIRSSQSGKISEINRIADAIARQCGGGQPVAPTNLQVQ